MLERSDNDNGWGRGVSSVSLTRVGTVNPVSLQRTAGFLTTLECCCGEWVWIQLPPPFVAAIQTSKCGEKD